MQLPWERAAWLEESTEWIQAQLTALDYIALGAVEVLHQRPWSTFARVATNKGIVYFKAPAPAFNYEASVTQLLACLHPDITVPFLAIDLERGWLLSADAGNTLRSASPSIDQIDHWVKILPVYVELQIEMTGYVQELLSLGMYDRRLRQLPHLFSELMD